MVFKKQSPDLADAFTRYQSPLCRRGYVVRIHNAAMANAQIIEGPMKRRLKEGDLVLCTDTGFSFYGNRTYSFNLLRELSMPTQDDPAAVDLVLHATFETLDVPGHFETEVGPSNFRDIHNGHVGFLGLKQEESVLASPRTGRVYTVNDKDFINSAIIDDHMRGRIKKGDLLVCTDMPESKGPFEFLAIEQRALGLKSLPHTFFHVIMDQEDWAVAFDPKSQLLSTHEFVELYEGRMSYDNDRQKYLPLPEPSLRQ